MLIVLIFVHVFWSHIREDTAKAGGGRQVRLCLDLPLTHINRLVRLVALASYSLHIGEIKECLARLGLDENETDSLNLIMPLANSISIHLKN